MLVWKRLLGFADGSPSPCAFLYSIVGGLLPGIIITTQQIS